MPALGLGAASCRADVDLGGGAVLGGNDGGAGDDAAPRVDLCAPCDPATRCTGGAVCARIADDLPYCATACPLGTECGNDERCSVVGTANGDDTIAACQPLAGSCAAAAPPSGPARERCGALVAPSAPAPCQACTRGAAACQTNGCYAGWWCHPTTARCEAPPSTCP